MPSLFLNQTPLKRSEFEASARKLATLLIERGVGEDDVIAVLMRNDVRCMEIVEACRLVGARYVMLNWHAATTEIKDILDDSGAKLMIGHADLLAGLDLDALDALPVFSIETPIEVAEAYDLTPEADLPPQVQNLANLVAASKRHEGDAPRFRGMFAYTSGSTGQPKGIKRNTDPSAPDPYLVYGGLARDMLGAQPGDKLMVAAPLYHSAPHALASISLASGFMDLVILPKFEPVAFLEMIEHHKVSHLYIVPTMMVRLLKLPEDVRKRFDVSSLKFAVSTGSPWPREIKEAMIDWMGPIFYESYGASEIGFMTLISSEEAIAKPGSVGKILPGGSFKIIGENGEECPPYELGTIYVKLPLFGDFAYTNADGTIVDDRIDGHATVGDMGHLDEDGYLFIGDRKKDMIISGGANIFPAEIEAQLIKMDEVADCAVFGAPDSEFGEQVVAAVQCAPGKSVTLEEVHTFLKPLLAKFKMPRLLDIHAELPREDSGKIFKKRLRAPYWEKESRKI